MNKILLALGAIVLIAILWWVSVYNGLVSNKAQVDKQWSNVEVQYQRRGDLVPQLVSTVSAAANFEKSTLTQVIEARSKATSVTVDNTNPQSLQEFESSQKELSGALSRLLVSVEAYPQLTATKGFQDLQSQLEWTENRIAVARGDYNNAAATWNAQVARVPTVFIARLIGFNPVVLFDGAPGVETAPKLDFNLGE